MNSRGQRSKLAVKAQGLMLQLSLEGQIYTNKAFRTLYIQRFQSIQEIIENKEILQYGGLFVGNGAEGL